MLGKKSNVRLLSMNGISHCLEKYQLYTFTQFFLSSSQLGAFHPHLFVIHDPYLLVKHEKNELATALKESPLLAHHQSPGKG